MSPPLLRIRNTQDGSVLVLALLVTLVILGVGLTALFLSSSGMKVSGNLTRRQEALAAAETGIDRASALINATWEANKDMDWDCFLGSAGGASGCPTGTSCTPTVGYDATKGNVLCDGTDPLENEPVVETEPFGTTAGATYKQNLTYTVYVRNDPVEIDSLTKAGISSPPPAFNDEDKRVVIRSEGRGRDGLAFFGIEVVLAVTKDVAPSGTGYTEQHLGATP
jgi:Tfp pilus assembly protein PilX